jgi:hypothetical protein
MSFVVDTNITMKKTLKYCMFFEKEKKKENESIYRSLIFDKDCHQLLSFTCPKSISFSKFIERNPQLDKTIIVNEIIVGTMIQLFYGDCWEIATKRDIGGNNAKSSSPTFRERFIGICRTNENNEELNDLHFLQELHRDYSYEFILTLDNCLFLVAVFKLDKNIATYISPDEYECWVGVVNAGFLFPKRIIQNSYEILRSTYASIYSESTAMGVMMTNCQTGDRTKMLNPNYFERKKVQALNDNFFFHYLCFLRINKIGDFLKYFPQYDKEFIECEKRFNAFIDGIYQSYLDYFVFKKTKNISFRFVHHVLWLHYHQYLPKREKITKEMIISYIVQLEPHLILQDVFSCL